ncbi:hypothetical protein ACFYWX_31885 [Streptomyces sp. NPDC002888]|uniref:hypothetical protein n=1 Tax=Streptomyces sp. NPDC002888 TaxID=3364668 RepID=UPI0036C79ED5
MADQLAFEVADSLNRIIPTDALGLTIRHAVLEDFAASVRVQRCRGGKFKAQFGIPAQLTGEVLQRSVSRNGELDAQALEEFFSRVVLREPAD